MNILGRDLKIMKSILLHAEGRNKSLTIRVPTSLGFELIKNLPDTNEYKKELIHEIKKEDRRVGHRFGLFRMMCDMYFGGKTND